ncbi:MAG: hypothetical protein ABFD63_01760 [Smithella sp.]
MGEVKRYFGGKEPQMKTLAPGQQIQVDLKNATPRVCECGCKYFIPVIAVYTVSALVSPTGQELTAQQPVLICKNCGELLK